ncbi:MAG TPA: hypothetical protein VIW73_12795 [Candidatus Cybelea sp.]
MMLSHGRGAAVRKRAGPFLALIAAGWLFTVPATAGDAGRVDGYVTPYYNSAGPVIKVGEDSAGLASKNSSEFVATILHMKQRLKSLNFVETYVAAIRLYDLGYRNEATYWFYTAQYKGRLFGLLVDQKKLGDMGDPGFELYHAQAAFFAVVGPSINGYAFGDIDSLISIIRRVQSENTSVPDVQRAYPGVAFVPKRQWQNVNARLNSGLGKMAGQLPNQKSQIAQQRLQNGTQSRYSHLTSKPFPGGL